MTERDEKDRLVFKSLDFEIILFDMFRNCKNTKEIEWLADQLHGAIDVICEEKKEEYHGKH